LHSARGPWFTFPALFWLGGHILQRNLKSMQAAVAQSQDKVTEYWKKVQAHEALLLEQVITLFFVWRCLSK